MFVILFAMLESLELLHGASMMFIIKAVERTVRNNCDMDLGVSWDLSAGGSYSLSQNEPFCIVGKPGMCRTTDKACFMLVPMTPSQVSSFFNKSLAKRHWKT